MSSTINVDKIKNSAGGATVQVDEIVNASGDNDSGIDLSAFNSLITDASDTASESISDVSSDLGFGSADSDIQDTEEPIIENLPDGVDGLGGYDKEGSLQTVWDEELNDCFVCLTGSFARLHSITSTQICIINNGLVCYDYELSEDGSILSWDWGYELSYVYPENQYNVQWYRPTFPFGSEELCTVSLIRESSIQAEQSQE